MSNLSEEEVERIRMELHKEIAQKGGKATAKKHGREFYRKLAAKSHAKRRENKGVDNSLHNSD